MVYLVPSAELQQLIGNVIRNNVIHAKYKILKQEPSTVASERYSSMTKICVI